MGRSLLLWSVAHHRLREQSCGKPGLGLACAGGELAELVDDPGFDAEAVELLDDRLFGFHGNQCVVRWRPRQPRLLRARIFALWRESSAGRARRGGRARVPDGGVRAARRRWLAMGTFPRAAGEAGGAIWDRGPSGAFGATSP